MIDQFPGNIGFEEMAKIHDEGYLRKLRMIVANSEAFKLAPPTRPPSQFSIDGSTSIPHGSLDEDFYNSLDHGIQRANESWCLEEGSVDIKQVKDLIDSMALIDTLDNHSSFISRLNDLCYQTYGFYSFSNKNAINDYLNLAQIFKRRT